MRIPSELLGQAGLISTAKSIDCSKCGKRVEFDIIHLLNPKEGDARAIGLLFDKDYYTISCRACGSSFEADWFPVIIDCSDIGLLIYSTPGIDDGGIVNGFRHYLSPMLDWMAVDVRDRICSTPFVAVYGANGLACLMAELGYLLRSDTSPLLNRRKSNWRAKPYWQDASEVPPIFNVPDGAPNWSPDLEFGIASGESTSIRVLHSTNQRTSFGTSDGYSYGSLFFFFPEHRPIEPLVHVCLKLTTGANGRSAKQAVYEAISNTGLSDQDHPWMLEELGRLAIECQPDAAESFLDRASKAEHTWLAVTQSFVDATPRRREDGEVIAEDRTAEQLRADAVQIRSRRHTVGRHWPGTRDFGLWYFPFSEDATAYSKYTADKLGQVYGEVIGAVERLIFVHSSDCVKQATFWWARAVESALLSLEEPAFKATFWAHYVSKAWGEQVTVRNPASVASAIAARLASRPDVPQEALSLWQSAIQFLRDL